MQNLYTVYDSKAEAYLPMFASQTAGTAIRAFTEAVNDPSHVFGRHAGDYTLFEIGTWNETTAEIIMHNAKLNLGMAINYLDQQGIRDPGMPDPKTGSLNLA